LLLFAVVQTGAQQSWLAKRVSALSQSRGGLGVPQSCHNEVARGDFNGTRWTALMQSEQVFSVLVSPRPLPRVAF
jgi:hypothetical protein